MIEPPIDERYEIAAEVMALRADNDRLREACERLIEACQDSDGAQYGTLSTGFVYALVAAALADEVKHD